MSQLETCLCQLRVMASSGDTGAVPQLFSPGLPGGQPGISKSRQPEALGTSGETVCSGLWCAGLGSEFHLQD